MPSSTSDEVLWYRADLDASVASVSDVLAELKELRLEEAEDGGDFVRGDKGAGGMTFLAETAPSVFCGSFAVPLVGCSPVREGRNCSIFAADRARWTAAADGVEAPGRFGLTAALFARAELTVCGGPVVFLRVGELLRDEFGDGFTARAEALGVPDTRHALPVAGLLTVGATCDFTGGGAPSVLVAPGGSAAERLAAFRAAAGPSSITPAHSRSQTSVSQVRSW